MCFLNSDNFPTVYSETPVRAARKPRRCRDCRGKIAAGDSYTNVAGKWADGFDSFGVCRRCWVLRDAVVRVELGEGCRPDEAAPPYGDLFNDVDDWGHYREAFRRLGLFDALAVCPEPEPEADPCSI